MSVDRNVSSWTSAQLLSDVRRKARLPPDTVDPSDDDLLRESSDAIWSLAGWALKLAGDGRLNFSFDRSVVASILSGPYRGSDEFLLPPQAVGDTIDNLIWVAADGATERRLDLIDVAEQADINPHSNNGPVAYAFTNGRVRVYPPASVGDGSLRFNYARRHGALCVDSSTNAPTVLSASDAGSGYTQLVLSAPSAPFVEGDYVDLVSDQYPYRIIFADLYVGAVTGASALVYVPYAYVPPAPDLAGMRLIKSGQTPFVSLPLEFRSCLSSKVASSVVNDLQLSAALEQASQNEMARLVQMIVPRSTSDRRKMINQHSFIRSRMRRGKRW